MADALLFRGGPTESIEASTVQSREIVIDTDTGQVVSGPSRKRTVMIEPNGDVLIGGTVPSAPNFKLEDNGDITAGTYNTITIGLGGGSDTSNTSIGRFALPSNTTGVSNTALGRNALYTNTTGRDNTAVGKAALNNNTDGSDNTALGLTALNSNTDGNDNTAVGKSALNSNADGNDNTALGQNALNSNTGGNDNTAVGSNAGFYIEGSSNTILGARKGTTADATLNDTVIISAGAIERARCDSNGDWDFGSIVLKSPNGTSFRLSVANNGTLSASAV